VVGRDLGLMNLRSMSIAFIFLAIVLDTSSMMPLSSNSLVLKNSLYSLCTSSLIEIAVSKIWFLIFRCLFNFWSLSGTMFHILLFPLMMRLPTWIRVFGLFSFLENKSQIYTSQSIEDVMSTLGLINGSHFKSMIEVWCALNNLTKTRSLC